MTVATRAMTPSTTGTHPELLEPTALTGLLDVPALAGGAGGPDVRIWTLDTATVPSAELDEARAWFDAEEQEQASAYVRAELRHAYEVAHAAARRVLGAVTGQDPEAVTWGRHDCPGCGEPHGRPRVEGADVEFSLAHTPGLVLVAVADHPVGVDVERHPDPAELTGLLGVLHPDEVSEVEQASDPADAVRRFTRAWTRTEAYLKGVGIGLGRDPQTDYLGTAAIPEREIDGWLVRDVRAPEGFGAAVATRPR
ncbi:4'-phosphopantetheinyl transferase family protein [Nocardioides sambongensis]|uniref:4'-phosphopantetheinyl transferase family protein n=1 Tax=Nocardioides sambongensis TaxID=2589074 RepID=UPI0015E8448C|nr:4'-phosphopantetheinyl transferase superfamily protein [Nocardioides sambongensis]